MLVVAHKSVPPEVVGGHGHHHHVGIVQLVVVANPSPHESPERLDFRVSSKSGNLLGFSLYIKIKSVTGVSGEDGDTYSALVYSRGVEEPTWQ